MKEFIHLRIRAFGYAFSGWWYVIRTQRNAWIHAIVSIITVLLCSFLNLPARDWAVIILTIALVWISEFLNTALEAVVDLAMPMHHPLARVGKDVGAAAVLISAITAVLVGFLIIGPALWERISQIFAR